MDFIRLFVAIDLPPELKKGIVDFEQRRSRFFKNEKWINPENLHLTILFLGYVNKEDLDKISTSLKTIASKFKPFEIKTLKIDYSPDYQKRMIWIYFEKNETLDRLEQLIKSTFIQTGINFKKEIREFLPHINLIRFKNPPYPQKILEDFKYKFTTKEIKLKQSRLQKPQAVYSDLKIFKLTV